MAFNNFNKNNQFMNHNFVYKYNPNYNTFYMKNSNNMNNTNFIDNNI